ncbi:ABC transporter substrate-binding protein [Halobaculum sp. P14]|uniref:ABC transporter substrate-binding protein n=1 Tax=Halobaculum sp. P14 TaxID=3421638 RepID=UPI003EB96782
MADDSSDHGTPTRRDYMKYGGAVVGGSLLAGCSGGSGDSSPEGETSTDETAESSGDQSYSVTIEPTGRVEFDEVPETWASLDAAEADMAYALGQGDGLVAYGEPKKLAGFTRWMDQLPDVTFDPTDAIQLKVDGTVDPELFYEADADVHLIDPNTLRIGDGARWSNEEIGEVSDRVGPFIGHFNRAPRPEGYPEYPMYSLYEQFEKYAQVYQQQERFEAFETVHDELLSEIRPELPPESERPTVGMFTGGFKPDEGRFDVRDFTRGGTEGKQYRDLGAINAFEDALEGRSYKATIDYELLLDVDPDVILIQWGAEHPRERYENRFFEPLRKNEFGAQLTAVQNGRLYMGADPAQGPIFNLFNTEMLAKQLYPEQFGEWKGLGEHTDAERLFDRQRVADIINGNI